MGRQKVAFDFKSLLKTRESIAQASKRGMASPNISFPKCSYIKSVI